MICCVHNASRIIVCASFLFGAYGFQSIEIPPLIAEKIPQAQELKGYEKVKESIQNIQSIGVDITGLCHPTSYEFHPVIPNCNDVPFRILEGTDVTNLIGDEEGQEDENESFNVFTFNLFMSFACVVLAALAAGLTMGLVSLDPLELAIKMHSSVDEHERKQCAKLLPIVEDHHRLLVTFLLLTSIANESLPLFLDQLVPGYVAIIISVTLILFFGEIIPSAIFTGPDQLAIAAKMVPLVNAFICFLMPLTFPIAKSLDYCLGHQHEEDVKYDRQELSTLVRIMYKKSAHERKKMIEVESLQSRETVPILRRTSENVSSYDAANIQRSLLTEDEVKIVEGALQMKEKMVQEVLKPWKDVFCEKKDTVLNEETISRLYKKGISRIPIYENKKNSKSICGVFMVRDLIMVNPDDKKRVSSMSLIQPECISPNMNLVDLLNKMQSGGNGLMRGGHLAIVCMNPELAAKALENKRSIPAEASVIGIVTLEDVIEHIIQEEIYDETERKTLGRRFSLTI